jgi:hypothetical protein
VHVTVPYWWSLVCVTMGYLYQPYLVSRKVSRMCHEAVTNVTNVTNFGIFGHFWCTMYFVGPGQQVSMLWSTMELEKKLDVAI